MEWTFSYTRGTLGNQCGRAILKSSATVSMARAKVVVQPANIAEKTQVRAKMWASGRNSRAWSPSTIWVEP